MVNPINSKFIKKTPSQEHWEGAEKPTDRRTSGRLARRERLDGQSNASWERSSACLQPADTADRGLPNTIRQSLALDHKWIGSRKAFFIRQFELRQVPFFTLGDGFQGQFIQLGETLG